ncbi:MAG: tetratricopeptide repeat protein [Alphaproteobacteria bacterium]
MLSFKSQFFFHSYLRLSIIALAGMCVSQVAWAQNAAVPLTPDVDNAQIVEVNVDEIEPSQITLSDPAQIVPPINAPDIEAQEVPDNVFYDAEALLPVGNQSAAGGVRFVDPRKEPGSRLVLVEKNHGAGTYKASLVSAQRAIKLGRYEAAEEILNGLYEKNKKDPAILMARAVTYQRLGRDDFAVQSYEALLDIQPENVDARINMLGIIAQRYPSVALRQLLDLKAENLNNVAIAAQLSVVYAALGEYEEALRYLGVAASMQPHNASHVFNMAVIADRAGAREEAVKYYEQALETDTLYGKGVSLPRDMIFERLADLR